MWEMTEIPHRTVDHHAPCLRELHGRVSAAGLALLPASNNTHQRPAVGGSCLPVSPITKQHGAVGRLSTYTSENGFRNKEPPRERCSSTGPCDSEVAGSAGAVGSEMLSSGWVWRQRQGSEADDLPTCLQQLQSQSVSLFLTALAVGVGQQGPDVLGLKTRGCKTPGSKGRGLGQWVGLTTQCWGY